MYLGVRPSSKDIISNVNIEKNKGKEGLVCKEFDSIMIMFRSMLELLLEIKKLGGSKHIMFAIKYYLSSL